MSSVYLLIPPGQRVRTIFAIAGPIMGGMVLQNLLNLYGSSHGGETWGAGARCRWHY